MLIEHFYSVVVVMAVVKILSPPKHHQPPTLPPIKPKGFKTMSIQHTSPKISHPYKTPQNHPPNLVGDPEDEGV